MKTSDLTGVALDWAVSTALGRKPQYDMRQFNSMWHGWYETDAEYRKMPRYSTDWDESGPIIGKMEGLVTKTWLESSAEIKCEVYLNNYEGTWVAFGPTMLTAILRCLVASKLGNEIELPKGLT